MSKKILVLFKRIEVDLGKERERIAKADYTPNQRKALAKLVDLFEEGKWQECLDLINDKQSFPYNENGEYSEKEHIGIEVSNLLHDMAYYNYYTGDALLEEAQEKLKKEKKEKKG